MKLGVRMSPHLDALIQGIRACGDTITGVDDTGCDAYIAWGWPQALDVYRKMPTWRAAPLICVDAHPFALRAGDRSGDRILQLDNWGALGKYPPGRASVRIRRLRGRKADGPALVIGQVYSAMQAAAGWVDVWHTGGYDEWIRQFEGRPEYRIRPHPRTWASEEPQPALTDDLKGCSRVLTWNSTCGVHARLLGFEAEAEEPHGWARMDLEQLQALRASPKALRSGEYWTEYREWLQSNP